MDGAWSRLQIGEYIGAKEFDDVDKDIGGCDTELRQSAPFDDRGLTCCVDPREAIEVRR